VCSPAAAENAGLDELTNRIAVAIVMGMLQMTNYVLHALLLLTACAFGFMGYLLIRDGFSSPRTTVLASWGENSLKVTQVGPGGFLAFLGATIGVAGFIAIHI
jgi:hypothetical protein